jgi:GIY-YIG catalytic domain-containing protein
MITTNKIFEIYGVDPAEVKLVRHGNKEIPIHETFLNDINRLEAYQSFQKPYKFGKSKTIAVFAPYYKTTGIFLGLWDIQGCTENSNFTEETLAVLREHNLPEDWFNDSVRYELKRNNILDDLSERLNVEWGPATVAWVQSKDKDVVEIKGKKSIGDFQSFSLVDLNYQDLKNIMQFPDTNLTWLKVLSSVNGVYLIKDKISGKLYVGSAYGNQGIYGRWSAYAKNGHGGNLELKDLDPSAFQFSILEIVPATTTVDGIIECENRWKEKLGTRQFGLNKN